MKKLTGGYYDNVQHHESMYVRCSILYTLCRVQIFVCVRVTKYQITWYNTVDY